MMDLLEEKLVRFVISIYGICENLSRGCASEYLSQQLMKAASLTALNFGVANNSQSEIEIKQMICSVDDRLREIYIHLQILYLSSLCNENERLEELLCENIELFAIVSGNKIEISMT